MKSQGPNILWLTYEDTSPQFVSCYGMTPVQTTPHIDALATEGIRLDRAYAPAPVCSASRTAIITGMCVESLGMGNHRSKYRLPDQVKGFPQILKEQGIYTSNNDKTDYNIENEGEFIKATWTESSKTAHWRNRSDANQRFFSVFNYMDSHQSRTMTEPWDWYEEKVLKQLDPSVRFDGSDVSMPPFYLDNPEMKRHFSRVYNSLRLCDQKIGERLAELKDDGLMDDTIIFCFADHGEGVPRGKCNALGFGYRAAFVIWFPEQYQHLNPWGGQRLTSELVSFEDLAPTILSLMGCAVPESITGRVFLGEQRAPEPELIFGARNRIDDAPDCCRSVMDRRFVYTRNYMPHLPLLKYQKYGDLGGIQRAIRRDFADGKLNAVQAEMLHQRPLESLYDLEADPWEVEDLAQNPQYQEVLLRMRQASLQHILESEDVMFLPESLMIETAECQTPYLSKGDQKYNPLQEMLKAADLVGRGEDVITQQVSLLQHPHVGVRYWAAVGLFAAKESLSQYLDGLTPLIADQAAQVQVELLAAVYGYVRDAEMQEHISSLIEHKDPFVAHQMIQKLIYLGDCAMDFLATGKRVQQQVNGGDVQYKGFQYFPLQHGVDIYCSLFGGEGLVNEDTRSLSRSEELLPLVRNPGY